MSTVVLASAGTGKTHALVDAWLRALLGLDDDVGGGDPQSLCAITFTERAAAEMKTRVERRLARLRFTPAEEPELLHAFAARGVEPPSAAALDAARRAVCRAPIGTFHALCARILREHALAAGLDPAFRVLDPDEEQRILREIVEAVVLDALAAGDGVAAELVARLPLRGMFQTRGLVDALAAVLSSLAERGLDPSMLGATRSALRVDDAIAAVSDALSIIESSGVKNTAARTAPARLRIAALQAVLRGDAGALSEDGDVEAALTRLFLELREGVGGNWGGSSLVEQRRALVEATDALGAALVDELTHGTAAGVRELLIEIDARQRREKDQRAVLGFGDLLVRTRDLLASDKSVRARVKARFRKIFVDEYQDTSPVQEQIVALLAEAPARGDALAAGPPLPQVRVPRGRLFVVGDPKQSIYGFRGADAAVFARAVEGLTQAQPPVAELRRLTTSRRSSAAVCALVNVVSGVVLPGHRGEELVPLQGGLAEPCGAWWHAGPALLTGRLPTVEMEAAIVADRLVAVLQAIERPPHAPFSPGDVAVLVRRGRAAAVLGRALSARGVPVRVIGGDGFWRRPEILDLVSALALVIDPRDELATLAVLRSPLVAVPDDQILALFEALPAPAVRAAREPFSWARVVAAADDDLVDRSVASRVHAFDALLHSLRARLATEPLVRCLDALLDEGGYAVACAVEPDADLRLRHVEKLRALCAGRPEEGVLLVSRLVDAVDDPPPEPVLFEAPAGESAVRVMTIHQSKGLEAEVVVLADAGIGLRGDADDIAYDPALGLAVSPRGRPIARCAPRSSSTTTHLTAIQRVRKTRRTRDEEELARLLYVALTRARRGIYVVGDAPRRGSASLLGLLTRARDTDPGAFDALLPPVVVEALGDARLPRTASSASFVSVLDEVKPASATLSRRAIPRVRASALLARAQAQLSIGLPLPGEGSEHDDDVLPPRARGRLAHAVLALVACERPAALDTADDARAAVLAGLEAIGAPALRQGGAVDDALVDAIVRTLRGPLRALRDEGRSLSFEEPITLVTDVAVVEAVADLVARGPRDAIVVELKLSAAAARAPSSVVQAQACCAALEQRGVGDLRYAVWAVGDPSPPPPSTWGKAARRELATVLARLGSVSP